MSNLLFVFEQEGAQIYEFNKNHCKIKAFC